MLVDLSNMSLGIRGTRFNANIKPNGNSEVALAEDSFGTVGQIEISSEGQTTSLTSTDQVIEVTETNEIAQREQSEEEKQEFKSVNETLVKVSKIDENELTQQLEQKLAKGNLQDANNDGVVDESDIEAAKKIGETIAAKTIKLGHKKVSFDRSGFKYHGRVKALAEGAREGGLEF